ncbi:MAG: glucan biosynthesis protein [Candidatus Methylacidiphilales bacterium]|nr:glucan biosynthesis protein [Candidatus Methylacidiphilales bacterium]
MNLRLHLWLGLLTVLALVLTYSPAAQPNFGFNDVDALAARLVNSPYTKPVNRLPEYLRHLDYDKLRDIRWKDEFTFWRKKGLPFQLRFFHLGNTFYEPVDINAVSSDGVHQIRFSNEFFNYGKNTFDPSTIGNIGYGGFRVHYPLNRPDFLDEVLVFQGASYFRALAKGQQYGLSARGIAINTLEGEDFPQFSRFWVRQPKRDATELTVYALLEGRDVTGAYEFTLRPGEETSMEVRAKLHFRNSVVRLGIAPGTSMYWYGEGDPKPKNANFRPEVHDSDGLLIQTGTGEWLWRPLIAEPFIQDYAFKDKNPKGFGLIQRDRDFEHYQDLEAKYHQRPSLFVEPRSDWGEGSVELIQLVTKDEYMDNVVAFWKPAQPIKAGTFMEFRYVMTWYNNHSGRPGLARVKQTLVDAPSDATRDTQIIVDFAGLELAEGAVPQVDITAAKPGTLGEVQVQKNDFDKSWRVTMKVRKRGKDEPPNELLCRLLVNNKPATETWTYTLHR